jgi:uncharacterized GH25 family protein
MNPVRLLSLAVALPLLFSSVANAHGLWTEQRRGNIEVVFGEGAEDDAFDPRGVTAAWAWNAEGKPVQLNIERLKDHARLAPAAPSAFTAVAFSAGLWTETTDGQWENKGRTEVKNPKQSMEVLKYSLALTTPYKQLPALDALGLVIVPEVDPSTLKPGQSLPVKVLSNGKPVADAEVFGDYRGAPSTVSGKTDAQGRASIAVRNEGLNVLAVETLAPVKGDSNIDSRAYFASLTFVGTPHAE